MGVPAGALQTSGLNPRYRRRFAFVQQGGLQSRAYE